MDQRVGQPHRHEVQRHATRPRRPRHGCVARLALGTRSRSAVAGRSRRAGRRSGTRPASARPRPTTSPTRPSPTRARKSQGQGRQQQGPAGQQPQNPAGDSPKTRRVRSGGSSNSPASPSGIHRANSMARGSHNRARLSSPTKADSPPRDSRTGSRTTPCAEPTANRQSAWRGSAQRVPSSRSTAREEQRGSPSSTQASDDQSASDEEHSGSPTGQQVKLVRDDGAGRKGRLSVPGRPTGPANKSPGQGGQSERRDDMTAESPSISKSQSDSEGESRGDQSGGARRWRTERTATGTEDRRQTHTPSEQGGGTLPATR